MKEFFDSRQDLERLNLINSESINFLLFDWVSQVLYRALLFLKAFFHIDQFSLWLKLFYGREIFDENFSSMKTLKYK